MRNISLTQQKRYTRISQQIGQDNCIADSI